MKNESSLIEYATFFGSIQILRYLKYKNVEMNSSLWIYAIHRKTPEITHFLEENQIEPPNETYNQCLCESIRCHHDAIDNYINDALLDERRINYKQIFKNNYI